MLSTEHAYLWADAGTGKTVTALEAFRKGGYDRGVILCPKSALSMWADEATKHLGCRAYVLYRGTVAKKHSAIILHADTKLLITTFDLARVHDTLINAFANGRPSIKKSSWRAEYTQDLQTVLILDEAHMLKNKDTKRTKSILGDYANVISGIMYHFTDTWQLTGTPIMRHADDLWTQLVVGRYDILKHYGVHRLEKWVNTFCMTKMVRYNDYGPMRKVTTGSRNLALLSTILDKCGVIKRNLNDVVADLPPITHSTINTDYTGVPNVPNIDISSLIRELADKDGVMAKVRSALGKAKVSSVVEYAVEFGNTPLLIGFWHRDVCKTMLEQLKVASPNWVIEVVDGSTSGKERDRIKEEFNAGRVDCLLGQMQAMNTSWNLQGSCSHVLIAEELPSPGMLHQFYSRVYRKGQKNHVHVDHMISRHSLDQAIRKIRLDKADVNEELAL